MYFLSKPFLIQILNLMNQILILLIFSTFSFAGKGSSVNFCVCHGGIKNKTNWKKLVLVGGLVFVESKEGGRFVLNSAGKSTPVGYKDNMICCDCAKNNADQLKEKNGNDGVLEKVVTQLKCEF